MQTVYVISGPVGVGKSTVSKLLASRVPSCALIVGDVLREEHVHIKSIDWEKQLELSWTNIFSHSGEYLNKGLNVVIDYVVEEEHDQMYYHAEEFERKIIYVVLVAQWETIQKRIEKRGDIESIARSKELLHKLKNEPRNHKHLLDTTHMSSDEVVDTVIKRQKDFLFSPLP